MLPAFDRPSTLIILPCSQGKARGGSVELSPGIADELPDALKTELTIARRHVAKRLELSGKIDETLRLPAYKRYTGFCYQTGVVGDLAESETHVLIISGGYGVVLATERIGWYDHPLDLGDWRPHIIERCLEQYARRRRLQVAVAFMARTGNYIEAVRRWGGEGVDSTYVVLPYTGKTGSQNSKLVPSAYGEALAAFLHDKLRPGWSSEENVSIRVEQLR